MLSGIVRIVSGRHIGTGFVVSADGLILTCADVLGLSMLEKVRVVFLGSGEEHDATVLVEGWHPVDAEDVAVLRVCGALPEGVQPLPLGSSQGIEGHSMVTFGYPEMGEVEGIRRGGMINVVIPMSPAREPLYLPTLVSSNAPRAHSDAFCASVRPRMPVMLSRS